MRSLALALFLLLTPAMVSAEGLLPDIPKGQGEKCVEDTDFMRRNHMKLLSHQRDLTMRDGIRTKQHSLKECISCHAVKDGDGKPVSIKDERHFCRTCHSYVAVKPDCFGCHASTPDPQEAGR